MTIPVRRQLSGQVSGREAALNGAGRAGSGPRRERAAPGAGRAGPVGDHREAAPRRAGSWVPG
ncbi:MULTISPECIES: hypothetical protein [Frankia]|uniref:hypothetical protein n=1 Tax=Frankia TaxID=1854 RepID=UPI000B0F456E|nr:MULTISPECIES: hypothetical protein [Frankia]